MALTTAQKRAAAKAKAAEAAAAAAAEELEEDEDIEELEEDEVEETPAKANKLPEITFGAAALAALLEKKTGKKVSTRELRTLLRKMARDGRLNREIIPGNRARYDWTGPNDPEVKAVVKAFTAGELEADKQEKLQALKDRKAEKKVAADAVAAKTPAKKTTKKAAKPVVEVDEDDDELELDDDE